VAYFVWQFRPEWPQIIADGRVRNYLPAFLPSLFAIGIGIGLVLRSRWARVASEVLATVLLVYCVSFCLIPPPGFWMSWAAAIYIILALFAAYAVVVAWFVKH
jgi:hypothetical protein